MRGLALIEMMREKHSVSELCDALEVSRSGFYARRARKDSPGVREAANARLSAEIKRIHSHRHTRFYGSPRMTSELKANV